MYLEIKGLCKSFGDHEVVKGLDLSLEEGKILCLLGPSGCGKTTTLKLCGGFLKPDGGRIYLDGEEITGLRPEERPVSTVFQSYALFPHLTVLENVCYGLKFQKVPKEKAREKALRYLEMVGLSECANARIQEISGGQQQRVALVRSMIVEPKLLLLDEPLSNLDAKLRVHMREEIRSIQEQFGMTMVFVTHDQEEAMVIGDEIAIMHEGRLVQRGTGEEIYRHPVNDFVRNFLGLSSAFHRKDGSLAVLRPEDLAFCPRGEGMLDAKILKEEFLGFYRQYLLENEQGEKILLRGCAREKRAEGEIVGLVDITEA